MNYEIGDQVVVYFIPDMLFTIIDKQYIIDLYNEEFTSYIVENEFKKFTVIDGEINHSLSQIRENKLKKIINDIKR